MVKNAAGYNMCRLMAGSRGTLGVITQATLMVRPLPEAAALLAAKYTDFKSAEELLAALVRLPIQPVAVEFSAGRPHDGNPLLGPSTTGASPGYTSASRGRKRRSPGCWSGSTNVGRRWG